MVAALTRRLGTEHFGLAEDVVPEALIQALRTWPFRGVPDNPEGWLMQVANNRALDLLRRDASLARKEEAIRLARQVAGHPALDLPRAHALAALLLLQAARNPARVDPEGNLLLLAEQDRALWDRGTIAAGLHHLDRSARGPEISALHLEAGIAAAHATAPSDAATDWPYILSL